MGTVCEHRPTPAGVRLGIHANGWPADAQCGESIAVNGCCLTLVESDSGTLRFDVVPQTISLTTMGQLTVGDSVNLERAMRADALLGGHFVQGHVDAVGTVLTVDRTGGGWRTRICVPAACCKHMVAQGSVSVDGISLTVAAIGPAWFEVALIPETLDRTTLKVRLAGTSVNVEVDVLAKMIAAQIAHHARAVPEVN